VNRLRVHTLNEPCWLGRGGINTNPSHVLSRTADERNCPAPTTPHQSPAWSRLGFRAGLGLALQIRRPIVPIITLERRRLNSFGQQTWARGPFCVLNSALSHKPEQARRPLCLPHCRALPCPLSFIERPTLSQPACILKPDVE